MYAVIESGGKQYRVVEGDRLDVERLDGDEVTLRPVMVVDGDEAVQELEFHACHRSGGPAGFAS